MKEYTVGEIVDFKVKSVFQSYCELQDEQTVTYLQNTDNMRLSKGQTLRCKILSASGLHPRVMLLDYGDIDHKENKVDERVLTEILGEMGVMWPIRDFVKLVLADSNDLSFDHQCHQWIQVMMEMQQDLCQIKSDCRSMLEMSRLLDSSGPSEREVFQERFTTIIELTGNYIVAKEMMEESSESAGAQEFIDSLLGKLRMSGYVYHPRKTFNILSSLFVLAPSLMNDNIERMFAVIKERDISQWKKEPFRTALLQVLELYVSGNEKVIDNMRDNTMLLYNTIQALSIQMPTLAIRIS